jgi:Berberine and berberine like
MSTGAVDSLTELRRSLSGAVIEPDDPGYDAARRCFNALIDRRPADVNYVQGDEPIERVRDAFGDESFERLQVLKSRYDQANVLHRNQNVPPLSRRRE